MLFSFIMEYHVHNIPVVNVWGRNSSKREEDWYPKIDDC